MTKKKRPRSQTYRAPRPSAPVQQDRAGEPRRGILGQIFGPRSAPLPGMPGIGSSLSRGFVTVLGSPWVVGAALGLLLVVWIGAVLVGFTGPFAVLASALSVPPISTLGVDRIIPFTVSTGSGLSLLVPILAMLAFRALLHALFTGALVDQLEGGAASHWSFLRGLRALPVTFAVAFAGLMVLTIGQSLAPLLGTLGLFVFLATIAIGVYLTAFAPVIALTEGLGALAAISRSVRAARIPGSGNLSFAAVYAAVSMVILLAPKPGSLLGVNPSVGAWLVSFLASIFHLSVQAAFAYRYLSIADDVPDAPVRPQRRSS